MCSGAESAARKCENLGHSVVPMRWPFARRQISLPIWSGSGASFGARRRVIMCAQRERVVTARSVRMFWSGSHLGDVTRIGISSVLARQVAVAAAYAQGRLRHGAGSTSFSVERRVARGGSSRAGDARAFCWFTLPLGAACGGGRAWRSCPRGR